MIRISSREEPDTHDPFEQSFRHGRIGLVEHMAERARLSCEVYGERNTGFNASAATDRERGALARFLVEAHQNHLRYWFAIRYDSSGEREFLLGLGLKEWEISAED